MGKLMGGTGDANEAPHTFMESMDVKCPAPPLKHLSTFLLSVVRICDRPMCQNVQWQKPSVGEIHSF